MSKLPNRPVQSGQVGFEKTKGLMSKSGDEIRKVISSHGIHLSPSDFSDLYLPSLLLSDESGLVHELSMNDDKQLLIDDMPIVDLSNFYSKKEIDELIKKTSILTSPNGTRWKPTIDDDGQVTYEKEVSDA